MQVKYKDNIINDDILSGLSYEIVNQCKIKNIMLSIAESLTGGLVSAYLVNIPGCGDILYESIVSYSNDSKRERLNVNAETLKSCGAVSREVAEEMAVGLLKNKNIALALSTTGLAGPTGDSEKKPIGLTYIGVGSTSGIRTCEYFFNGNREQIRYQAVYEALNALIETLSKL